MLVASVNEYRFDVREDDLRRVILVLGVNPLDRPDARRGHSRATSGPSLATESVALGPNEVGDDGCRGACGDDRARTAPAVLASSRASSAYPRFVSRGLRAIPRSLTQQISVVIAATSDAPPAATPTSFQMDPRRSADRTDTTLRSRISSPLV